MASTGQNSKPTSGTLWLDGKEFAKGPFALLQQKKMEYCRNYGISRERAAKRFKLTY